MNEQSIVYVHTGLWPSHSPSTVFVTGTADGLAAHAPSVLYVRNGAETETEEVYRSISGKTTPENLEIIREGYGGKVPGHAAFFRRAVKYIAGQAKNGRIRAVISRNTGFLPYMVYLRKRYGVPCFYETHDFFGDLGFRSDLKKTLHIRRNSFYERSCIPRLNGIICLTETQRELFAKYYPDTVSALARTGLFDVVKSVVSRDKRVAYVGSLDPHKGVGLVLSALRMTADKEIGLFIIGGKNEHEMREFMELANLVGVAERVTISGWIHHSDIGSMMDRSMAGIVPLSDTPFNRHITSPLKIFDCFSRSLPVIGSDLPPVRELVEDTVHGLLYTPGDPESLASALDRFFGGGLFNEMSPQVEKHARSYTYDIRGKAIIDFIDGYSG